MKLERVLLVEDDQAFRERLATALHRRRLTVWQAANPVEAKLVATREKLDGAVVDLRMPGGSGLDVVRDVHALQPATRLIVLTGFGSIATALEAVRLGAADYVTKPADADQILSALRGEAVSHDIPEKHSESIPSLDRVEWEHIQRVLHETGGNVSRTARLLGLDRRSLQRKLAKYPPHR
jgi:two-component system, response regulator RegA